MTEQTVMQLGVALGSQRNVWLAYAGGAHGEIGLCVSRKREQLSKVGLRARLDLRDRSMVKGHQAAG